MTNEGGTARSPSKQSKEKDSEAGKGDREPWRPLPSDLAETFNDALFVSIKQEPMEENCPLSDFSITTLNAIIPKSTNDCQSLQSAQSSQQTIPAEEESLAEPDTYCKGADVVPPLIPSEVSSTPAIAILTFSDVSSSHYADPVPMDTTAPQEQPTPQADTTSINRQREGAIICNSSPNDWAPSTASGSRNKNLKSATRAHKHSNLTSSVKAQRSPITSGNVNATYERPRGIMKKQNQRRPASTHSARRQAGPSSISERRDRPKVAKRNSSTPSSQQSNPSAKTAKSRRPERSQIKHSRGVQDYGCLHSCLRLLRNGCRRVGSVAVVGIGRPTVRHTEA
ncbi:hypothetical protein ANCCAN_19403 [Ancylostoma caninum]|uniref:Uncharacterized protein n=1 Tax=Ancylostoma caninum TaxID=29170 RepID=A0A368FRA7_ANCCA|nr:hypothetical protein ANCCAN_19403 [Ancylostoma caninum]